MKRKRIKKKTLNDAERFLKRNVKNKSVQVVLVALLGVGFYFYNDVYLNSISSSHLVENNYNKVTCVDGDTFKLDGVTMRMLAIDTPETVKPNTPVQPFGKEASSFTCDAITKAKNIEIKQDKGNEKDRYDRELVWVLVDGELLQEKIIEEGLGEIKYVQKKTVDKKYLSDLNKAQEKAQNEKKGIWSQN